MYRLPIICCEFEFGDAAKGFVERQNLTVRKCP